MRQAAWRQSPALLVASIALFVALGGSVYAAAKINGKTIKVKSLPGNRLKPGSVPANRLKPGVLAATRPSAPLTGAAIDEGSLGRVPSAAHAEIADSARTATDAETAVKALDAETVNGHSAGCLPSTQRFAGACWETTPNNAATAPAAAVSCAEDGGTLPEALQLAAFAAEPGINLDPGDEWSGDIVNYTAEDAYAIATVSTTGVVGSGLFNGGGASTSLKYRCVIPLLR